MKLLGFILRRAADGNRLFPSTPSHTRFRQATPRVHLASRHRSLGQNKKTPFCFRQNLQRTTSAGFGKHILTLQVEGKVGFSVKVVFFLTQAKPELRDLIEMFLLIQNKIKSFQFSVTAVRDKALRQELKPKKDNQSCFHKPWPTWTRAPL